MPHRTGLVQRTQDFIGGPGHAVGLLNPTVDSLWMLYVFALVVLNRVTVVTFIAAVRQSCKQVS